MTLTSTKDPRNALASWDGYEFQGQIALIVVLEMLIQGGISVEDYELMLEDLEDFSIYCNGKRVSTHQVKATKDKTINDYKKTLYQMAVGLQKNDEGTKTKAYLHTSNPLDTSNWVEKIQVAIDGFVPATKTELEKCILDSKQMAKRIEELRERYRTKGTFKKRTQGTWEKIYCSMDDVNHESEILDTKLKSAIEKYLQSMVIVDLSKDNLLDRILYYKYHNNNHVNRKDTRQRIEELIKEYWGEEAELKKGSESKYRYELQEIIHQYVVNHHEGNSSNERIKFTEIEKILTEKSIGTREYTILRNKDMFFEKMTEYCEDACKKVCEGCEYCDVYEKMLWFQRMSNQEIEKAFYLMSPHVNKPLEKDSNIVSEDGLMDSYFHTLSNMEFGKIVHNAKVVYQVGKDNCMLTDININRNGRAGLVKGLIENEIIEKICHNIIKNREFAKERMEIDSLIVSNPIEKEIRIDELCKTVMESTRIEDEWSYLKITKKKDISLVDATHFIDKHK